MTHPRLKKKTHAWSLWIHSRRQINFSTSNAPSLVTTITGILNTQQNLGLFLHHSEHQETTGSQRQLATTEKVHKDSWFLGQRFTNTAGYYGKGSQKQLVCRTKVHNHKDNYWLGAQVHKDTQLLGHMFTKTAGYWGKGSQRQLVSRAMVFTDSWLLGQRFPKTAGYWGKSSKTGGYWAKCSQR